MIMTTSKKMVQIDVMELHLMHEQDKKDLAKIFDAAVEHLCAEGYSELANQAIALREYVLNEIPKSVDPVLPS